MKYPLLIRFTLINIYQFLYGFDSKLIWKYEYRRAYLRPYRYQLKLCQWYQYGAEQSIGKT